MHVSEGARGAPKCLRHTNAHAQYTRSIKPEFVTQQLTYGYITGRNRMNSALVCRLRSQLPLVLCSPRWSTECLLSGASTTVEDLSPWNSVATIPTTQSGATVSRYVRYL